MERVAPKKARVPQPNVIAARVANLFDKDFLLARDPVKFFTGPHYDGVVERPDDYILSHATPELAPHESPRGDGHVTD
jgi:hypothetical protein